MNQTCTMKQPNDYLNRQAKHSLLKIVKGRKGSIEKSIPQKTNKLRILSIDGGGIRAILPAVLLANLEAQLKKRKRQSGSQYRRLLRPLCRNQRRRHSDFSLPDT